MKKIATIAAVAVGIALSTGVPAHANDDAANGKSITVSWYAPYVNGDKAGVMAQGGIAHGYPQYSTKEELISKLGLKCGQKYVIQKDTMVGPSDEIAALTARGILRPGEDKNLTKDWTVEIKVNSCDTETAKIPPVTSTRSIPTATHKVTATSTKPAPVSTTTTTAPKATAVATSTSRVTPITSTSKPAVVESDEVLPYTGADSVIMFLMGLGAVVVGVGAILYGNRKR